MDHEALEQEIRDLAKPAMDANDVQLLDVEFLSQAGRMVIRLTIDRPDGVGVEDCAAMSRQMSDILDVHDVIEPAHVLEVSSPGLDRKLKKPSDFAWAEGRDIKLSIRQPLEGKYTFKGRLTKFDGDLIILDAEEGLIEFKLAEVAKARLDPGDPFGKNGSGRKKAGWR